MTRFDDWWLLCPWRHICLSRHAIICVIDISGSLHLGWKVCGQIFMSQIVILGKTSAHPDSLIAIAAQYATRFIVCSVPYIELSFTGATLLSLISLARCRYLWCLHSDFLRPGWFRCRIFQRTPVLRALSFQLILLQSVIIVRWVYSIDSILGHWVGIIHIWGMSMHRKLAWCRCIDFLLALMSLYHGLTLLYYNSSRLTATWLRTWLWDTCYWVWAVTAAWYCNFCHLLSSATNGTSYFRLYEGRDRFRRSHCKNLFWRLFSSFSFFRYRNVYYNISIKISYQTNWR